MKKMGRPFKEQTRLSHEVKMRLDDETYEKLCSYCGETKQKSEVIRTALRKFLEDESKDK